MTKEVQSTNNEENVKDRRSYDLEERTAEFGEEIIDLAKIYRG